jgi:hypothetical protein
MANPKRPRDPNQRAKLIVDIATGEAEDARDEVLTPTERGHLGGVKGGKARAKRLTAEQRSEQARRAAEARWSRDL